MAAAKRVRWECPAGEHPGVLGSTRPPKDSIVRYCLPCSAESGRLVQRVAPALERQRAAKTARRKERAASEREREYRRRYVVETADGVTIDVLGELYAMDCPELRTRLREEGRRATWRPKLTVHRGSKGHVSGHAKVWEDGIHLTVGAGADSFEVREVLLHELIHAILPAMEWHGSRFRTALCRAAGELFGVRVHPDDHSKVYGLDALIVERMREKGRAA